MDNHLLNKNTAAYRFMTWASFVLALGLTLGGVWLMESPSWMKFYLVMGVFFLISSAFTLAKTLRDDFENERLVNRLSGAKTEKILKEYEDMTY
ncbi:hypothetical protein SAMN05421823_103628 [Catalinimonas alkaloidigena]|uniref:YiaAB two helix domain-containing protein n=1 Tax=Catalinimonas alkaloidigena TaxID=1075417 RepID=A0A1G9EZM3_9BACT|nr:YiaA/YiaB family inner membrane protein [Catalinimonas alkaloidigena]SDK81493.1 hypothetical protein SAMN05421823_103628 [Catalinimonas alkaloidigena]